jgi:transposase
MVEQRAALQEEKRKLVEENLTLEKEVVNLREEAERLRKKVATLKEQLDLYTQRLFGRRSERYANPNQTDLFDRFLDLPEGALSQQSAEESSESVEKISYTRRRSKGRRGPKPLPEHLPRVRVEIDPPEDQRTCGCCGVPMQRVGEKITEELDVIPPQFRVKQLVQGEWRCPPCMNRNLVKPLPPRPIERGRPSPTLLSYIVVSKYGDHLPLYRQEQIFARYGIHLPRSTMNEWLGQLSGLLLPTVGEVKRGLLLSPFLQSDDTRIQVLDPELKGKSRRCYLWSYTIPGGEVIFDFTTTHSAKGPSKFLGQWRGDLQCDGHACYNDLFKTGLVHHIGCMAHVRRKFFEARESSRERVTEILDLIRDLYAVERHADENGIRGEALVALRIEKALPVFEVLEAKIIELAPRATPQSRLGRAVKYARGQWEALRRYLHSAEARIDNNWCENSLRPIVLNRKNSLFLGSQEGGSQRATVFFSLVQSCRQLKINPFTYLCDVIERISTHPHSRIRELTPRGWKEAREAAVKAPT